MFDNYVVCDCEVYRNYFLVAFKSITTGKVVYFEKIDDGEDEDFDSVVDLDRDGICRIMNKRTIVTFNGLSFDFPIIAAAIDGKSCGKLKYISDCIIQQNLKPWVTEKQFDLSIPRSWDHIDLIEVAPLRASLKLYNGRLHGRRMQDLPHDPDERLTRSQMVEVRDYCINDLDATALLFKACQEPITLRRALGKQWNIDLRSKSDAQVAEGLIKERLTRVLGDKPKKPKLDDNYKFTYKVPPYVRSDNLQLAKIIERLRTHEFIVNHHGGVEAPEFLIDEPVRIGFGEYRMGIGGIHSSEQNQMFEATDDDSLVDRDVKSYYPLLMITQQLTPKHLGKAFLNIYTDIVETRILEKDRVKPLKKAGKIAESKTCAMNADSLKIAVNGTFGKLGSIYSVLFAPDLLIQVTISGQLLLLMVIEATEKAGMRVISANTDGFVTVVPKGREADFAKIIEDWEAMTGLVTEETRYKGLYSRDVNNYLAIKVDEISTKEDGTVEVKPGEAKAKGAFLNCWEDMDSPNYREMMQKNPESSICLEAAVKRIRDGTPVWKTIRECRDIRKFVNIRTVNGGSTYDGEYLGKAIRWYYGHSSAGCIQILKSGNKVAKTDNAVPLMTLPDEFPSDVNYDIYIENSLGLLGDLGFIPVITPKHVVPAMYKEIFKRIKKASK